MKKLQLKALQLGARELLSREQLRNVLGGSDGSDDGGDSGGSGSCGKDAIAACENKSEGSACCVSFDGTVIEGTCRAFAPGFILHCSDLN